MSDSPLPLATNSLENRVREWGIASLISVCVSLALLAPFFRLGTASGHDIAFHMASWLDAAGQWKQGILFPRWTEWANFGFGEPRFIFYPPLSWLFGAFLGTILPWQSVAAVFVGCVQTLAGLSAYAFFRRIAGSRPAALLGSACFAANPYSLLIIYMRSDFAELLAIAIFPLLMLATERLIGLLPDENELQFRKIVFFAIPFCAIWLCNAPASVIATYSVALLFLVAALQRRSVFLLANGAAGMALGFGLASFYLVPAIYEQRWVQISAALYGGLTPADNFLYAKTSDAEHDAFNRIASHIAILLALWAICAALTAWRGFSRANAGKVKSDRFVLLAVLSLSAIVLMFPVANVLWRFLPELRFVQFPWRWMSMIALCALSFTTAAARGSLRWAWFFLAAVTIAASAQYLVKHAWWDTEDMPGLQAAIEDGIGFEGTDEYDPAGDDHADLPRRLPRAHIERHDSAPLAQNEPGVIVEKWNAERRALRIVSATPANVALRLLKYPAWRITVNGEAVTASHSEGTAAMIVPVPAGESELRIDFTRTADRALGGWISTASLITSLSILAFRRRSPRIAKV
jgi:6-pyruvoyl-tetrahydropterin synthase related domain